MFGTGVCECVHRVEHFLAIGELHCVDMKLVSGAIATFFFFFT